MIFSLFFFILAICPVKMSLRFGANLNFLFRETGGNVLEQFRLARAAGFRGVEMACPEQLSKDEVAAAQKENEIEVVLLNIRLGELSK